MKIECWVTGIGLECGFAGLVELGCPEEGGVLGGCGCGDGEYSHEYDMIGFHIFICYFYGFGHYIILVIKLHCWHLTTHHMPKNSG